MEVIIGDRESLPNITAFTDWWSYGDGTSSVNMGAFRNNLPLQDIWMKGINKGKGQLLDFDASRVSDIYKNKAHVAPNNIVFTYWKRFQ